MDTYFDDVIPQKEMMTSLAFLFKQQYRPILVLSRLFSSKQSDKIEGIRENFSEYEVRLYFDQWLKSLWLAPNQWIHSTRDRSLRITRCFVPFWNISLQGSIQCSLSTKSNLPFHHDENYYSHKEWHTFPLKLENISLNNLNIYAAENLDRYHVQRLDVSFDDVELIELNKKENFIEKATIDQKTAFNHAWVLIIKPLLENMCLEQAKKIYPKFDDPRIDSFHLTLTSKEERLFHYPIYIINYNYHSQVNYTCLFDGLTGHITGDRQYSLVKVTAATLTGFYPIVKIGLFAFGSFANLLFAFELAADFSFIVALPIALIIAPCVGFYARSYPRLYRRDISQVQWIQDQSKASKFTYQSIEDEKQELVSEGYQTLDDITEIKSVDKQNKDFDSSIENSKKSQD